MKHWLRFQNLALLYGGYPEGTFFVRKTHMLQSGFSRSLRLYIKNLIRVNIPSHTKWKDMITD